MKSSKETGSKFAKKLRSQGIVTMRFLHKLLSVFYLEETFCSSFFLLIGIISFEMEHKIKNERKWKRGGSLN